MEQVRKQPNRARVTLLVASLLSLSILVLMTVPVRVMPPGSPGGDPWSGLVAHATMSEWTGVPNWAFVSVWALLLSVSWFGERIKSDLARWASTVLAVVLGLSILAFAARGYWVSLTGFDVPQPGSAAYLMWVLSGIALAAFALAVSICPAIARGRGLPYLGAMSMAFIPSTAGLLTVGYRIQSGSAEPEVWVGVAAGVIWVVSTVVLLALALPAWRRFQRSRASTPLLSWLSRIVVAVGAVTALVWAARVAVLVFGAGAAVSSLLGPVLFMVLALLPVAVISDATNNRPSHETGAVGVV